MKILALNCGSSSVKFALVEAGEGAPRILARGHVEPVGSREGAAVCEEPGAPRRLRIVALPDHDHAIRAALEMLVEAEAGIIRTREEIEAVGHRMVHGGDRFREPALITQEVVRVIQDCVPLAPLHNPHNLKGYFACASLLPHAAHVAVFDTAFHQTMPAKAYTYALPQDLCERYRVRRYGFHGASHRWLAERYAELHGRPMGDFKLITCHLGNGCSMCAIEGGRSVDTSMGMTPLEGLVMGTRAGDVDAAAVLRLMQWEGLSIERMDALLNKGSGLYGISGISNDMRTLLEQAARGDGRAELAIEVFCYRIRKYLGAYYAVLDGAHAVIFTGGIGENAPEIRARVCRSLDALGIRLDEQRNRAAIGREMDLSAEGARTRVWVIPTNEETLIARETLRALRAAGRYRP
ncbi:MAG: acetate kinase [Bryobacterales bacterium]|nr:acetate kinase [Bryobacteraceae bacterium]MDW8128994.1 acetate kinase [Bryobacterales bacterium]